MVLAAEGGDNDSSPDSFDRALRCGAVRGAGVCGGGRAVVLDVVSSEDVNESSLHNAIEQLRDPTHVRMLPPSELDAGLARAGFGDIAHATWDMSRELEEWLDIVNDPARAEPLRIVVRALAETGRSAGIGLSTRDGRVVFFHRWRLVTATKPA